jgi:predicted Zn-dependent protease
MSWSRNAALVTILSMAAAVTAYAERRHGKIHEIGKRHVAGKIFGFLPNLISIGREMEIGAAIAQQIEQTARMIEDRDVCSYVERVAQDIIKHSDAKIPFRVSIVDTFDVNAFAFPGGYLYLNLGILLVAENEAEFAGVIAHEISHVTARHAARSLSKSRYMEFAAIPASFFGGSWVQMGIHAALGFGMDLQLLGISRRSEKEADQLGIQYMWNTGYDPGAFVSFLEKLQDQEDIKPGRFASWFRTHPCAEDRIAAAMDEQRYLPDKECYIIDTSQFRQLKSRLLALYNPGRDRTSAAPASNRPVLKRRKIEEESIGADEPGETGKGADGGDGKGAEPRPKARPVLKRPGAQVP